MNQVLARSSQISGGVKVTATRVKQRRSQQAGFTLAELLAVVVMVGILATIAAVSYRRYMTSAKVSEATAMVGAIRAAQESYRAETMRYLDVSGAYNRWHPAEPNKQKRAWDYPSHADYAKWQQLGVRSDGPVYFGYLTYAGLAGEDVRTPTGVSANFNFPDSPAEPWYIVQAAGDLDGDDERCYVVGSSFTSEIYVENEGE